MTKLFIICALLACIGVKGLHVASTDDDSIVSGSWLASHTFSEPKPKIVIASLCAEEKKDYYGAHTDTYSNITTANHKRYAAKHGYDYIVKTEQYNTDLPVRYQKAILLLDILDKKLWDWVFWTDCDTLFMKMSTPLEHFMPKESNVTMIISGDKNQVLNSGQFWIRDRGWVRDMLEVVKGGCQKQCACEKYHGGGDQQLFNYFVFNGDCAASRDKTAGNLGTKAVCEKRVQQSPYKDELACAEIMTNDGDYAKHKAEGKLFRVHVAGGQAGKYGLLKKFAGLVEN